MKSFEQQEGISFILIYFKEREAYYYMRCQELLTFWQRAEEGGRKSFRREELNEAYFFHPGNAVFVPYLDMLQKDLEDR
jgi:recombination protein U